MVEVYALALSHIGFLAHLNYVYPYSCTIRILMLIFICFYMLYSYYYSSFICTICTSILILHICILTPLEVLHIQWRKVHIELELVGKSSDDRAFLN